jgi:DedD protein
MDQGKLRYRIVGGVVLLALLAILVPVLNDVRQPLPQGPQAIDIPAEPADGLTAQVPTDGMTPDDVAPQPDDVPEPLPAPPLTEVAPAPDIDGAAPVEPYSPPEPPAPAADPEPAKPAPVPTPKAVLPRPAPPKPAAPHAAKPVPAAPVAPATPVAKPVPAPKPPVAAPAKPTPVVKAAPTGAPAPAPSPTAKPPAPSPAAPVTAPATQQAWVVQLGVYGNLKTAIDLRERLRKAGHSAFTEEVVTPHGKALRVRVGPDLDRAAAQALRDRLARETGHDGIVMAYP